MPEESICTYFSEEDLSELIEITIVVKGKKILDNIIHSQVPCSIDNFEENFGVDTYAFNRVKKFLVERNLRITSLDAGARCVSVKASLALFEKMFHIRFYKRGDGPVKMQRHYSGDVVILEELSDIVECVYGLDDVKFIMPYFEIAEHKRRFVPRKLLRGYYPSEVGKLYNFPSNFDGTGQCIALIELGGGYRMQDIHDYFIKLDMPVPTVEHVCVFGRGNKPTTVNSDDREVMLDILVAASIAPAAKIVVYFAPNNERGFYTALSKAIHDKINKPNIISLSWGAPEKKWGKKSLTSFNELFITASALGITICAASGDSGSSGGIQDGNVHVDFPASSPYVLSCGGTRLLAKDNCIISEVVWHEGDYAAGGGGVSEFFEQPDYQSDKGIPRSLNSSRYKGRGVPDIAGNAAYSTGYKIIVDGVPVIIGGTSAVAPLYAGLIALMNQKNGAAMGFINPYLYSNPNFFREVVKGNNITSKPQLGYKASPGWNACTGLGVLCRLE